jgi:hypothetical protein
LELPTKTIAPNVTAMSTETAAIKIKRLAMRKYLNIEKLVS